MNLVAQEVHMKLLQIDSSARSSSVTRQLTAKFVAVDVQTRSDFDTVTVDLGTNKLV